MLDEIQVGDEVRTPSGGVGVVLSIVYYPINNHQTLVRVQMNPPRNYTGVWDVRDLKLVSSHSTPTETRSPPKCDCGAVIARAPMHFTWCSTQVGEQ